MCDLRRAGAACAGEYPRWWSQLYCMASGGALPCSAWRLQPMRRGGRQGTQCTGGVRGRRARAPSAPISFNEETSLTWARMTLGPVMDTEMGFACGRCVEQRRGGGCAPEPHPMRMRPSADVAVSDMQRSVMSPNVKYSWVSAASISAGTHCALLGLYIQKPPADTCGVVLRGWCAEEAVRCGYVHPRVQGRCGGCPRGSGVTCDDFFVCFGGAAYH